MTDSNDQQKVLAELSELRERLAIAQKEIEKLKADKNDEVIQTASDTYVLPKPSPEQSDVVNHLKSGYNIMLNAVAGSGKTTTALHVAIECKKSRILLLTYNKKLKDETRRKICDLKLTNIEAHSFHAMGYQYYNEDCQRDKGLQNVVQSDSAVRRNKLLPNYDIIMIDEAQDMKYILYAFVCKIIRDIRDLYNECPIMLVVGDVNQDINGFQGSDSRFLTHANLLFEQYVGKKWVTLNLKTSYRVTGNMATFINEVMLGRENMIAHKGLGFMVQYCVGKSYDTVDFFFSEIKKLLRNGAQCEDIFVLASSIKSDKLTPLVKLEQKLSDANISVFRQVDDNDRIHSSVYEGKVLFSNFNQAKGLERKYVFVFGFNSSYFKYYEKEENPNPDHVRTACSPKLYVVASRATERLYIMAEEIPGEHLSFLRVNRIIDLEDRNIVRVVTSKIGDIFCFRKYWLSAGAKSSINGDALINSTSNVDTISNSEPYTSDDCSSSNTQIVEFTNSSAPMNSSSSAPMNSSSSAPMSSSSSVPMNSSSSVPMNSSSSAPMNSSPSAPMNSSSFAPMNSSPSVPMNSSSPAPMSSSPSAPMSSSSSAPMSSSSPSKENVNEEISDLPQDFTKCIFATNLIRYLPPAIITKAVKLLSPRRLRKKLAECIRLPDTTKCQNGLSESVSELNGLAIPAMLEVEILGTCSMYDQLIEVSKDCTENMHEYIRARLATLRKPNEMKTPAHFLELATLFQAGASLDSRGFISKLKQLTSFDWITNSKAIQCKDVLRTAIYSDIEITNDSNEINNKCDFLFEEVLEATVIWNSKPAKSLTILGSIDIATKSTIWEVKCVSHVSDSHFLQLGVYAWLWRRSRELSHGEKRFKLVNIIDGEIWEINSDIVILDKIMNLYFQHHFRSQTNITDVDFLQHALEVSVRSPSNEAFDLSPYSTSFTTSAVPNTTSSSSSSSETVTPTSNSNCNSPNNNNSVSSSSPLKNSRNNNNKDDTLGFQSTYDYHLELQGLKQNEQLHLVTDNSNLKQNEQLHLIADSSNLTRNEQLHLVADNSNLKRNEQLHLDNCNKRVCT